MERSVLKNISINWNDENKVYISRDSDTNLSGEGENIMLSLYALFLTTKLELKVNAKDYKLTYLPGIKYVEGREAKEVISEGTKTEADKEADKAAEEAESKKR